jgi:hypothetical protein
LYLKYTLLLQINRRTLLNLSSIINIIFTIVHLALLLLRFLFNEIYKFLVGTRIIPIVVTHQTYITLLLIIAYHQILPEIFGLVDHLEAPDLGV